MRKMKCRVKKEYCLELVCEECGATDSFIIGYYANGGPAKTAIPTHAWNGWILYKNGKACEICPGCCIKHSKEVVDKNPDKYPDGIDLPTLSVVTADKSKRKGKGRQLEMRSEYGGSYRLGDK